MPLLTAFLPVKKTLKALENIRAEQIPFALSSAMRDTVKAAASEAAQGAKESFDNPTDRVTQDPTKSGKKGMIRFQYDSKRKIQRIGVNKANAKVFVLDGFEQEMYHNIFGGNPTNVPDGFQGRMTPTAAVIKGIYGRGRLRHLNKYGNLDDLYKGAAFKASKNSYEFVNVPLLGAGPRLEGMHAGLYMRVFAKRQPNGSVTPYTEEFARRRKQNRARRGVQRDAKGRFVDDGGRNTQLIMLFAYEPEGEKTYKRKFPYDQIVQREFTTKFRVLYAQHLTNAIKTQRVR